MMTTRSIDPGTGPRPAKLLPTTWLCAALVLLLGLAGQPLAAQEGGPLLTGAVGIRVTPTAVRPDALEADLDLTMYTRVGPYPSTYAGVPYFGLPAIDYGDGSTLPSTTLVLASSGGGPGGSNVYKNLASFTHTYPSHSAFTVTAASYCTFCARIQYALFPQGSPVPPTFSYSYDYIPQTVIGNLAGKYVYSGTTPVFFFSSYSVRYLTTYYAAVTNTALVDLRSVLEVPTTSAWGLALLGGLLLLSGLAVLRHA